MATKITADELLKIARKQKPDVRYTRNRQGTAIAAHNGERWETVAMKTLMGTWCSVGDLFIDGKPANDPAEWIE